MRIASLLFFCLVGTVIMSSGQNIATFDDLVLSRPDTFYVNYSMPNTDVGFNDGLGHFPTYFDTSYGYTTWSSFSYSNVTDSTTSGFGNQYAAKTGIGFDSSPNYAVVACFNQITYANTVTMGLTGRATGQPVRGFYVTNSTYAYNSMRSGDGFARKFHNGDWFKLTVQGYYGGLLKPDSVTFYLADFLFPDTTMNYIVKTWEWVNLLSLGKVDSLQFSLSSTDNSMYGMNTPSYFCMDNFTTDEGASLAAAQPRSLTEARVYPNPSTGFLYIDQADQAFNRAVISDIIGNIIADYPLVGIRNEINTSNLQSGQYILTLFGNNGNSALRFVKY